MVLQKQPQRRKKGALSDKDRLELANARAGAGQEHTIKEGKLESTTSKERRDTEVKNTAQKGVDIEEAKEKIRIANVPEGQGEELLAQKLANEEEVVESEKSIIPFTEKGDVATNVAGGVGLAAGAAVLAGGVGAIAAGVAAAPVVLTGGALIGGVYLIDKFLLSPSEIANWAAVDNVAGALNFESSDINRAVGAGELDLEVGKGIIEKNIKTAVNMKSEVVSITSQNPKLWASSKVMRTSVDTAIEGMQLKLFRLEQLG